MNGIKVRHGYFLGLRIMDSYDMLLRMGFQVHDYVITCNIVVFYSGPFFFLGGIFIRSGTMAG